MNANLTNSNPSILDQWLSATSSTVVICNQIINLMASLPLNSYILLLFFTGGVARDMFATFVVNQAASEILLSFVAPLSIMCHVSSDLCYAKPLGFFWGISMSARTLFQCCICLERYLAVVHPIAFLKYNKMRYRLSCMAGTWTACLACSIMTIFTFPGLPYHFMGVMYGAVLAAELFCCLSILRVLKRPGPSEMEMKRESKEAGRNSVKRRAFIIIFINLLAFLIQTIPMSTTFLFQQLFISPNAFNLAVAICMSFSFAAGFVNPVYFLLKVERPTLLRCFRWCFSLGLFERMW